MRYGVIALLGVPIDCVSLQESIKRIVTLEEEFLEDRRPRYVSTVNVDFLMQSLSVWPSMTRHPELLWALRKSDFVTADGAPLVFLSYLLGDSLPERVAGSDLVPLLFEELARQRKKVFFLGGSPSQMMLASQKVAVQYPELQIVGATSPFVCVEGEDLAEADVVDSAIAEKINEAKPDVLLIALGNPKQEIWFQRMQKKLTVPVSIGVGGVFAFISGRIPRAPKFMQRLGLEWLYRVYQEPRRLFTRYLVDLVKFSLICTPLLIYTFAHLLFAKNRRKEKAPIQNFGVGEEGIAVVPLALLDSELAKNAEILILDFAGWEHLRPSQLGELISLWNERDSARKELFFVHVSGSLHRLFLFSRLQDLFSPLIQSHVGALVRRITLAPFRRSLYFSFVQTSTYSLYGLFGQLDREQVEGKICTRILEESSQDVAFILDLTFCRFIDSAGMGWLLKIRRERQIIDKPLIICGLNEDIRQALHIVKAHKLFVIEEDVNSALLKCRV